MHTKNVNVTQAESANAETILSNKHDQQNCESPVKKQIFESIPENSFLHRLHQQFQRQQPADQHSNTTQPQQHNTQNEHSTEQQHIRITASGDQPQQQLQQQVQNQHKQQLYHHHHQQQQQNQRFPQLGPTMSPNSASPYQPPPLPPRCQPRSPVREDLARAQMVSYADGVCGPYKPVPPPKPYPHSPTSPPGPDGAPLPHILVTEQGRFHTHSTKFPPQQPLPPHAIGATGGLHNGSGSTSGLGGSSGPGDSSGPGPLPLQGGAPETSTRPSTQGGDDRDVLLPGQDLNMPSARPSNSTIPPEGTLAGLLPTQHYHPLQPDPHHYNPQPYKSHQHPQSVQKNSTDHPYLHIPTNSADSPYIHVPKNSADSGPGHLSSAAANGNLGIPINGDLNEFQPHGGILRETWARASQGLRMRDPHAISEHPRNGHIPNGVLPNGALKDGEFHPVPPPKPTHNGHVNGHWGQLNHGYQHTSDGGVIGATNNGFRGEEMNKHHFVNGYHQTSNHQENHSNGETIHLHNGSKTDTRLQPEECVRGTQSNFNGYVQRINGHSPQSTTSAPADEINTANERQEEQRKDDRWGSLKKGLKYTNLKGIIASKFSGRHESKEDHRNAMISSSQNAEAQKVHSLDESLNKREKNTNLMFQSRLNQTSNFPGTGNCNINADREEVVQANHAPQNTAPNGFHYGAPLRSSVVHFDLPKSNERLGNEFETNGNQMPKRSGSYHQLNQQPIQQPLVQSQQQLLRQQNRFYSSEMNDVLPSDRTYGSNGRTASIGMLSTAGAEGTSSTDSGRGTAGSGAGGVTDRRSGHNTSVDSGASSNRPNGHSSGNDSEWVDITESDVNKSHAKNGFPPQARGPQQRFPIAIAPRKSPSGNGPSNAPVMGTANLGALRNSGHNASRKSLVRRESLAATPPLPPLSPEASPRASLHASPARAEGNQRRSFSSSVLNQPDLLEAADRLRNGLPVDLRVNSREGGTAMPDAARRWRQQDRRYEHNLPPLLNRHSTGRLDVEPSELTEATDVLDLESMLGGNTEATSDEEAYDPDVNLIRKQLEGLEGMYSEVLKLLGGNGGRKLKSSRRRLHGSMSSLPSSIVSATRLKDKRRSAAGLLEDRLKRGPARDGGKGIQRRFQRLESHVVTLARSVAHLSAEMRSQNAIFQEMESIRNDITALRTSGIPQNHIATNPVRNGAIHNSKNNWDIFKTGGPGLNNPNRVKKLTQFFGDEPPLVRLFLRKLGYEKYAPVFEQEKIGMLELPYLDEDRLLKLGIPLGPRVRILQEAQGPITTDGNLSVYVV